MQPQQLILFESASGFGLFEVNEAEEIGALKDAVQVSSFIPLESGLHNSSDRVVENGIAHCGLRSGTGSLRSMLWHQDISVRCLALRAS